MSNQKRFTIAGITTHARAGVTVTKVRYGNDLPRLAKMLSSNRKIGVSYDLGGRGDGFLDAVRVDLVNLPTEMTKEETLAHLAGLPEFSSADDQFVIKEAQHSRAAKARSAAKRAEKVVKGTPSLEAIRARGVKTEA